MTIRTPLGDLIKAKMKDLGIQCQALGFRLGYQNPAKATGCVYALCDGHISSGKREKALERFPGAIEVPSEVVETAVECTRAFLAEVQRQIDEEQRLAYEEEWAEWSARFTPHAVLRGTFKSPSQIVIFGISGGAEEYLIIRLDASRSPVTFVQQVQAALPNRLYGWSVGRPQVPFFGDAVGYVINYSPDHAVRFDLEGQPIEELDRAVRPGHVSLFLGNGRPVSATTLARAMGQSVLAISSLGAEQE